MTQPLPRLVLKGLARDLLPEQVDEILERNNADPTARKDWLAVIDMQKGSGKR